MVSICDRRRVNDNVSHLSSRVCEQQRNIPDCASAQSGQRLCYSLVGKYHKFTSVQVYLEI